MRIGCINRQTRETDVHIEINLDGSGNESIATGIGFFDHMLTQLAVHGGLDLTVRCQGDLEVDGHHSVEDCGIALGQALDAALGDRIGIRRYATCFIPLDEALAVTHLDISGRPYYVMRATLPDVYIGAFEAPLAMEFFRAVAMNAKITLHMDVPYGDNIHHVVEALFKSFAHALQSAATRDSNRLLSTKGIL